MDFPDEVPALCVQETLQEFADIVRRLLVDERLENGDIMACGELLDSNVCGDAYPVHEGPDGGFVGFCDEPSEEFVGGFEHAPDMCLVKSVDDRLKLPDPVLPQRLR